MGSPRFLPPVPRTTLASRKTWINLTNNNNGQRGLALGLSCGPAAAHLRARSQHGACDAMQRSAVLESLCGVTPELTLTRLSHHATTAHGLHGSASRKAHNVRDRPVARRSSLYGFTRLPSRSAPSSAGAPTNRLLSNLPPTLETLLNGSFCSCSSCYADNAHVSLHAPQPRL